MDRRSGKPGENAKGGIDTARTLEIGASPGRFAAMAVLALIMAVMSGVIALALLPETQPGVLYRLVGFAGLGIFGAAAILLALLASRRRGPVLTLSPEGVRDMRLSDQTIPWSAVRDVGTWDITNPEARRAMARMPLGTPAQSKAVVASSRIIVLEVDPEIESRIMRNRLVGWARRAGLGYGVEGLAVPTMDLKIGHEELLKTTRAYWTAAKGDG